MLRIRSLPVTVAAVLAVSACAAGGGVSSRAPQAPDASPTQSQTAPPTDAPGPGGEQPSADASQPGSAEPSAGAAAPSADASRPGTASPEPPSALAAVPGDHGVPGLPANSGASVDDVLRLGAVAGWAEPPALIALSLPASSSCWAVVAEPVVESPSRILLRVAQPQPCEAPDAARTYSVAVPDGIDASGGLQLSIVGLAQEFTLTLPPR